MNPRHFIYLSDQGIDEYINAMAYNSGATPTNTNEFVYEHSDRPIVLRGILKYKLMQRCLQDSRDFYYVDTGYLAKKSTNSRKHVKKLWHRIVKNDLQHNAIVKRDDSRFKSLNISLPAQQRHGSKIVVAAPDDKPCRYYGIDLDEWITSTVNTLRQHTDRPIVVRHRIKNRAMRMTTNSLEQVLKEDTHALVTFNSNAATESILQGIPAFVLAPSHAAMPVANRNLNQIETPFWPDQDLLHLWACHLAYCQVHVREIMRESIWDIIK